MVYSVRFRVHVFDVNAFNEASALTLLRFMQQAASDASTAVGYPPAWYEENGTLWLIRRTALVVENVAHYHDVIEVRTWVSDIRRVRSHREYELRLENGTLLGRGGSDWVYVDLRKGTPVQPPRQMQQALMPDGVVSRRRESRWLQPPLSAFETWRRVEFAAIDTVAHVNNAMYVTYIEQDLWDALAGNGYTIDPAATQGHFQLAAHDIEYFRPAAYGDVLHGLTWVTSVEDRGIRSAHVLRLNGDTAVAAQSEWRWSNGRLPAAVREAAERLWRHG